MQRVQLSTINLVSFRQESAEANRRRPGRIRCERLGCSGGQVLDLSLTGARIRLRTLAAPRPGQRRRMVFETVLGASLPFPVVVRWVRPAGLMRHEVGVEFRELDESRVAQLKEMSRVHGGRTILGGAAA